MKKTRTFLAVCTALTAHATAIGGELTFSPTLDAGLYKTHISSPQEVLRRQDVVSFAKLTTEAEYDSRHYTSQFKHAVSSYTYSDTKNIDSTIQDVSWANQLKLWQDRILLDQSVHQWREAYDQIGGSFSDDVYSDKAPVKRIDERYGASYQAPSASIFDASLYSRLEVARIEADKLYTGSTPTHQQKSNMHGWSFGNLSKKKPLLWQWTGNLSRESRRKDMDFDQWDSQLKAQFPVHSRWHLATEGAIQRYKSTTPWNYGGDDRTVETVTKGIGAAWIKHAETSFVRVTMVHVDDSDQIPQWDWNAEASWFFADRWAFQATKNTRFYGDSYDAEFSYQNNESKFSLTANENVKLRYIPVATQLNRGIYICTPGSEPLESLDLDRCELPPVGDVSLLPGQVIFSDISTYYPLSPRLSLYRHAGIKWTFDGERWSHTLWLRAGDDEELTVVSQQRAYEGFFEGDLRLGAQTFLKGKWRYRSLQSKDIAEIQHTDRFYSLGYHYEINRQSEWSVTLQNVNKQTFTGMYDYQDYRVMLNYKYFFGVHHKDRRELFPN